jgi:hypothetical protein
MREKIKAFLGWIWFPAVMTGIIGFGAWFIGREFNNHKESEYRRLLGQDATAACKAETHSRSDKVVEDDCEHQLLLSRFETEYGYRPFSLWNITGRVGHQFALQTRFIQNVVPPNKKVLSESYGAIQQEIESVPELRGRGKLVSMQLHSPSSGGRLGGHFVFSKDRSATTFNYDARQSTAALILTENNNAPDAYGNPPDFQYPKAVLMDATKPLTTTFRGTIHPSPEDIRDTRLLFDAVSMAYGRLNTNTRGALNRMLEKIPAQDTLGANLYELVKVESVAFRIPPYSVLSRQ